MPDNLAAVIWIWMAIQFPIAIVTGRILQRAGAVPAPQLLSRAAEGGLSLESATTQA